MKIPASEYGVLQRSARASFQVSRHSPDGVFTDLLPVLRYHADEEMLAVFTISGPGNHTVTESFAAYAYVYKQVLMYYKLRNRRNAAA